MRKHSILLCIILFIASCKNNVLNNDAAKTSSINIISYNIIGTDFNFSNKEIIIDVPGMCRKYFFCSDKIKLCDFSHPTIDSQYICRYGTWIKKNDSILIKFTKSTGRIGIGKPINKYTAIQQYNKYKFVNKDIDENDELKLNYIRKNIKSSPDLFKIIDNNNCEWTKQL